MNDIANVQPGRYRHSKGKEYTVVGTAVCDLCRDLMEPPL